MASPIKVTDNTGLNDLIKELESRNALPKAILAGMEDARDEMVSRARRGQGLKGGFKGYSESYKRFKAGRGRIKKGAKSRRRQKSHQINPVDLTFTNTMLRSFRSKVKKVSGGYLGLIIPRRDQQDKIRKIEAGGREFFGLTKKMKATIVKGMDSYLKEIL